MPKSSRRTWPSGVTRMLAGFRSRCTTSRACAKATASATCSSSRDARAQIERAPPAVGVDRLRRRRTPAPGTGGRGRRRRRRTAARCAGVRALARMSRSRAKRCGQAAAPRPACGSFSATWRSSSAVGALGQPDRAHAAVAELADQPVGADHGAGNRLRHPFWSPREPSLRCRREVVRLGCGVPCQQIAAACLPAAAHPRAARPANVACSAAGRSSASSSRLDRRCRSATARVMVCRDRASTRIRETGPGPDILAAAVRQGRRGRAPHPIAASSSSRAFSQSRRTVRSVRPSASAISASVRPPK